MSDSGLQKFIQNFPEISRKSASTLVEMVSGNLRPTQKKPTPRPRYLTTSRNSYVSPTVRRRPGSVYENGDYYLALPAVVGVIPTRNTIPY